MVAVFPYPARFFFDIIAVLNLLVLLNVILHFLQNKPILLSSLTHAFNEQVIFFLESNPIFLIVNSHELVSEVGSFFSHSFILLEEKFVLFIEIEEAFLPEGRLALLFVIFRWVLLVALLLIVLGRILFVPLLLVIFGRILIILYALLALGIIALLVVLRRIILRMVFALGILLLLALHVLVILLLLLLILKVLLVLGSSSSLRVPLRNWLSLLALWDRLSLRDWLPLGDSLWLCWLWGHLLRLGWLRGHLRYGLGLLFLLGLFWVGTRIRGLMIILWDRMALWVLILRRDMISLLIVISMLRGYGLSGMCMMDHIPLLLGRKRSLMSLNIVNLAILIDELLNMWWRNRVLDNLLGMVILLGHDCVVGRKDYLLLSLGLGNRGSLWLRNVLLRNLLRGTLLYLNHLLGRNLLLDLLRDSWLLPALSGIDRLADIGLRLGLINSLLLGNWFVDLRDNAALLWRYSSLHVVIRNHNRRITSPWMNHLLLALTT
jgi:hypothetical protein